MLISKPRPGFGAKLQHPDWYASVNSIIATLREHSTLNTICAHLNAQQFTTPSGKEWTKIRLASYLAQNKLN